MSGPRVLVADDNPLSLRFLAEATESIGCIVMTAADGVEAVAIADETACDLLLLDLCMPRIGGLEALGRIRSGGASRHAVALATTAAGEAVGDEALRGARFAAVLRKPLSIADLHKALLTHLPAIRKPASELDDARALSVAGGDMTIVAALRGLLAAELHVLPQEVERFTATRDVAGLRDRLHRLDASCGFCGVPALASAARELRAAVEGGDWPPEAFTRFLRECADVQDRLRTLSS